MTVLSWDCPESPWERRNLRLYELGSCWVGGISSPPPFPGLENFEMKLLMLGGRLLDVSELL